METEWRDRTNTKPLWLRTAGIASELRKPTTISQSRTPTGGSQLDQQYVIKRQISVKTACGLEYGDCPLMQTLAAICGVQRDHGRA
jgi:hypothetical protein